MCVYIILVFKWNIKVKKVLSWRCISYLEEIATCQGLKLKFSQSVKLYNLIFCFRISYYVYEKSKYSIVSLYFCLIPSHSSHLRLKYLFRSCFAVYIRGKYDEFHATNFPRHNMISFLPLSYTCLFRIAEYKITNLPNGIFRKYDKKRR